MRNDTFAISQPVAPATDASAPSTSSTTSPSAAPASDLERAVVLGASLGGLLAARVLTGRYAEVVLLERDRLPDAAAPRKGTPHAIHPHGLLAKGREVLETLFPGFTDAMIARGALSGDMGLAVVVDADGERFARSESGVSSLGASRLAIEAELRRRVLALPAVKLVDGVDILEPVFDAESGKVTAARYRSRPVTGDDGGARSADDGRAQRAYGDPAVNTLRAALVIDCTGRASRAPAWLEAWGFGAPAEDRVEIGLAYTSAYFERDAAADPEVRAVIGTTTPRSPWPYVLIAQEPDASGTARWIAGVGGYAGDHVAVSREAMAERATTAGCAEIADLARDGRLVGPVMRYAFPHSQRRRYERMKRLPAGLLLLGDSIASFNPIFGQGMTVAACEALALADALARERDPQRIARHYFRAAARIVDTPWQLAVGADLALPCVKGERPRSVRLINAYVDRLKRAAVRDAVVADAFRRVIHLVAPPVSLFAPSIVARVIAHGGAGAVAARTGHDGASAGRDAALASSSQRAGRGAPTPIH